MVVRHRCGKEIDHPKKKGLSVRLAFLVFFYSNLSLCLAYNVETVSPKACATTTAPSMMESEMALLYGRSALSPRGSKAVSVGREQSLITCAQWSECGQKSYPICTIGHEVA